MDTVQEAIDKIVDNNWIDALRQCKSIKEALDKLMVLLPEILAWDTMPARRLVCYLQRIYQIDFGVCKAYIVEGDEQYCTIDGLKVECLCAIPEAYCVFRDKDGKPKYPEFSHIVLLETMEDYKGCAGM